MNYYNTKTILIALIERLLPQRANRFYGNFATWEDAADACQSSYASEEILDKVIKATREVVSGKAAFERDSVLFFHEEYNQKLLEELKKLRRMTKGTLVVIDFGGAMGSTYWQHRKFINDLAPIHWCVVEQPHIVAHGQKEFQSDQLRFYDSLQSCLAQQGCTLFLLASVLNYLPQYQDILNQIIDANPMSIICERTIMLDKQDSPERIAIQCVPPSIYQAHYPLRLLDEQTLLQTFPEKFQLTANHFDNDPAVCLFNPLQLAYCKSYIWHNMERF